MIDWLAAGIADATTAIRLNRVVHEVRWGPGSVEVLASGPLGSPETVAGRCAILTLPLGVLRAPSGSAGAVRFAPELPGKGAAASRLEMGAALKGTFRFQERFWSGLPLRDGAKAGGMDRLGFLRAPGRPFPTWWTTYPLLTPLLSCWVAGPAAERMAELEDADLFDRALDSLAVALSLPRAEAEALVQDWHFHNWQRDPFSRGAYSYVGVGGLAGQRALAEPVADTLFFAGEATEFSGHHATVHGAIATGLRAARQALAAGTGG